MTDAPKIFPLGLGAMTVDFGNSISVSLNDKAISVASYFEEHRFPGFIEAVPAYSSVAIYYDVVETRRHFSEFGTAFAAVSSLVDAALRQPLDPSTTHGRMIEVPVDFTDDLALDMESIAAYSGLAHSAVIDVFTAKRYRVHMIGFLPGFAYMGEVDERIAVPRKDSPRKLVPRGSVGIAGWQTGIYPLESPGGWQIIGRTPIEMFTPDGATPSLLRAGDEVRFVPV
jgi:inhibitor of KinA